MKRIASFIVDKRYAVLAVMLLISILCALLIPRVQINTDMSKYLPKDSSMKQGLDIMESEFPEAELTQTIRVMFTDLDAAEQDRLYQRLSSIPYVDHVAYEADSADYHQGPYTLFTLHTVYSYASPEERAIESTLEQDFADYEMTWKNDNSASSDIPLWILALAVAILLVILLIMCGSWIEPILFLIAIGLAILINLGTNVMLESVSNITYAMAAILQLVLSMDYSIILINRYRQERARTPDPYCAMKDALTKAFPAILSSSVTTIVGLLALVFMSFQIGRDLGVVLAKGVLISMICIFTILPGLILLCGRLIEKTAKKQLHLPMRGIGGFSYRFRRVIAGGFAVLFLGAFLLQSNTETVYTLVTDDPIAEIFPPSNTIVMLYENTDEAALSEIAAQIQQDPQVKSVSHYSSTLGKPHTSTQLAAALAEMDGDVALDPAMLDLIYYHYFTDGRLPTMTMSALIHFITDEVMKHDTFASYLDDGMMDSAGQLERFADAGNLTRSMSMDELADFFGMDPAQIRQLLLYYYIQHGGAESGRMRLPVFAEFISGEVAADAQYASLLDQSARASVQQLSLFTDADRVCTPISSDRMAKLLGMEEQTARLLFTYYQASDPDYDPGRMSLPDFVRYVRSDVGQDPFFAGFFDQQTMALLDQLTQYTDPQRITSQLSSAELAAALDMDPALTDLLFALYHGRDAAGGGRMTLAQFSGFVVDSVLDQPLFAGAFDDTAKAQIIGLNQLIQAAAAAQPLPAAQLAAITGVDNLLIEGLFAYQAGISGEEVTAMTLPAFVDLLLERIAADDTLAAYFDDTALARLNMTGQLVHAAAAGQAFTATELARLMGMETQLADLLFPLYYGGASTAQTMSMAQLITYLLSEEIAGNELLAASFDQQTIRQLTMMQTIMNASQAGTQYESAQLAQLLGMDSSMVKLLYTYRAAAAQGDSWRLSVQTAIDFLVSHGTQLAGLLPGDSLAQLQMAQKLIHGSLAGTRYTAAELAGLIGMDSAQIEQLYLLYTSMHGDTSGWRMSVQQLIDFVNREVLYEDAFAGTFDAQSVRELRTAKTLIDAVVSARLYTADQAIKLLEGVSDQLDPDTVKLLYLYYGSQHYRDPNWQLSLQSLVDYLAGELIDDPLFATVMDDALRGEIGQMQGNMDDALRQLQGPRYSRLLIHTTLPGESAQTTAFFERLIAECDAKLTGEYYLIGDSAMNHEMAKSFGGEMLRITLLTAIAIFIVVALTFRSVLIPAILVLIVQCGVYLTITAIGLQGYSIYYLALLIVQCILMGATIDYGILFTSYYRENRRTMEAREALIGAYHGSIHTILTSGLIMILVTGIIGYCFSDPTIGQICRTISIGALSATLLILFVLPCLLATFDRVIAKKSRWQRRREQTHKSE